MTEPEELINQRPVDPWHGSQCDPDPALEAPDPAAMPGKPEPKPDPPPDLLKAVEEAVRRMGGPVLPAFDPTSLPLTVGDLAACAYVVAMQREHAVSSEGRRQLASAAIDFGLIYCEERRRRLLLGL